MFYTHFSLKERFRIENLLSFGWTQCDIAFDLHRSEGSVSKEITRNGGKRLYDAHKAHTRARCARKEARQKSKKLVANPALASEVEQKLHATWSPEQISGCLKILCHETIYQWIYTERKDLIVLLRRKRDKYRRRHGTAQREKRREDAKKKRIDTRGTIVDRKERIGDWEGDTIVGGERTTGILTHVERKSGYLMGDLLKKKNATMVKNKAIKRFSRLRKDQRHTITYDNGCEFSAHEFIERGIGVQVYFAYPYHSWERGCNENANGLLREFFPKGTLFATLTQRDVDDAVELINHRPRKRLGYLTPHEVFVQGKSFSSS